MDGTWLPRLQAAEALANTGRLTEAEADCRGVLRTAPEQPEALALLGIILTRLDRFDEARMLLERAIQYRADVPQWFFELGRLHQRSYRLGEALDAARKAARLDPHNPRYMKGLAQIHFDRGEDSAARAILLEVLAIAPDDFDAHLAMAHALLSQGEFAAGWIEYEWRLRSPLHQRNAPRMIRPAWNGMMLPGKRLLLVADQGFGDAFYFSRYVPAAASRCAGAVVLCRGAQAGLFARLDGVRAVVTDMADVGEHAAFAFLGSLPNVFGVDIGTAPWLTPDPARRLAWRDRLARRLPGVDLRIGLVWAGNPENTSDWRRSVSLASLRGLAGVAGVRLVSLQPLVGDGDRATMAELRIVDLSAELTDFGETAAAIANLDLVVTVDSAVAHLAGALGVPTWVLLHHPADWRWLTGREDSKWYPSIRLFRQERAGDWDTPIRRLIEEVRDWAGGDGEVQKPGYPG